MIPAILKTKKIFKVLKDNKVKRIAVFGSFSRGEETKKSDIDFLVEFQKDADLFDQVGLQQSLERILKRPVDITTPRAISRYIRRQVLKEAIYL